MDISVQYADPVKEDLISCNDWGQLWSNCKRGGGNADSLVAELGTALEDALVLLSTSAAPLEGADISDLEKKNESEELIIDQDKTLPATSENKLGVHDVLPCSSSMLCCDAPVSNNDENYEISHNASDGKSSMDFGKPSSTTIVSLPTSLKLVSAMKGSREKQGLHTGKLSVNWAPDVYEPPHTSQSHTVKSHNQYAGYMSKKSHRHKSKRKGKSPRSRNTEKK